MIKLLKIYFVRFWRESQRERKRELQNISLNET